MRVPELDERLGMLTYLTEGDGIGGRIKERLSDFIVDEVLMGRRASRVLLGLEDFPSEGPYHYVVAAKFTKVGTRELVSLISRELGGRVRYAGLKDARAVTFQFFSIEGRFRLREVRNGVWIRPAGRLREPLSKGRNDGNHFTVVVRGADLTSSIPNRFPNFFSYQRFGVRPPFNHEIGKALLLRDLRSATSMMADQGYETQGRSLRQLASEVGVELLRFYIHSYQSYLFNLLLSKRLFEGLDPRRGDLVVKENGEVSLYPEDGELVLPIPGAYTRVRGWASEALRDLLREEDVSLDLFLFRELPEISALGDLRAALARAKSLTSLWRGNNLVLSFFLDRGTYATSFLREIIKPTDPVAQGFH